MLFLQLRHLFSRQGHFAILQRNRFLLRQRHHQKKNVEQKYFVDLNGPHLHQFQNRIFLYYNPVSQYLLLPLKLQ